MFSLTKSSVFTVAKVRQLPVAVRVSAIVSMIERIGSTMNIDVLSVVVEARSQQFENLAKLAMSEKQRVENATEERPWVLHNVKLSTHGVATLVAQCPEQLDFVGNCDAGGLPTFPSVVKGTYSAAGKLEFAVSIEEACRMQIAIYIAVRESLRSTAEKGENVHIYYCWIMRSSHHSPNNGLYLTLDFCTSSPVHGNVHNTVDARLFYGPIRDHFTNFTNGIGRIGQDAGPEAVYHDLRTHCLQSCKILGTACNHMTHSGSDERDAILCAQSVRQILLEDVEKSMCNEF